MNNLSIEGRQIEAMQVLKLRPELVASARSAAAINGADDVFFTVGRDTFVASGRGLDVKGLPEGAAVRFGDQVGRLLDVDDEINTAWEGAKWGLEGNGPLPLIAGTVTGGIFASHRLAAHSDLKYYYGDLFTEAELAASAKQARSEALRGGLKVGFGVALFTAALASASSAYEGANRPVNLERLKEFAY